MPAQLPGSESYLQVEQGESAANAMANLDIQGVYGGAGVAPDGVYGGAGVASAGFAVQGVYGGAGITPQDIYGAGDDGDDEEYDMPHAWEQESYDTPKAS